MRLLLQRLLVQAVIRASRAVVKKAVPALAHRGDDAHRLSAVAEKQLGDSGHDPYPAEYKSSLSLIGVVASSQFPEGGAGLNTSAALLRTEVTLS